MLIIFGLNISLLLPILINITRSILIITIVILSCTIKSKTSFSVPYIVQLLLINLIQSLSYIPELLIETETITVSPIQTISTYCKCFAFVPSNLSSIFWILIITIKLYTALARAETFITNKTQRRLVLFIVCYLFPLLCGTALYVILSVVGFDTTDDITTAAAVNVFNYVTYGISAAVMCGIVVLYVLLMVELRKNSYKEALTEIMRVVLNVLMFSVVEIVYLVLCFMILHNDIKTSKNPIKGFIYSIKALIFPFVYLSSGINRKVLKSAIHKRKHSVKKGNNNESGSSLSLFADTKEQDDIDYYYDDDGDGE